MNDRNFWRAHDQYYSPPEEEEDDDCEDCEGCGFIKENEEDDEENAEFCKTCDGHGKISRAQKRRDYLEEKGERDYQAYKDRKSEEND